MPSIKSLPSIVVEPGMAVLDIGTVLDGKYELVRLLGAGGMGMVYEAKHLRLQQRVAIKILHPAIAHRDDLVRRFEREARATARLTDPHIVEILDVDVSASGTPYMVLEYLEGHDLGREIEQHGRLDPSFAADLILQAATGMADAHAAGIVHRDLKPSNLFLVPLQGTQSRYFVKVVDFGISHVEDEQEGRLTATRNMIGTPLYMSPEQIRAPQLVDPRSDIWSLGMILYECLAGRLPFEGTLMQVAASVVSDPIPPPRHYAPAVPAGLERVVMQMLERNVAQRYASCTDLVAALQSFAPSAPVSARLRRVATPSVGFSKEARMRVLAQIEPLLAARAAASAQARAGSPNAITEARAQPTLPAPPSAPPRRRSVFAFGAAGLALCVGIGVLALWPRPPRPSAPAAPAATRAAQETPVVETVEAPVAAPVAQETASAPKPRPSAPPPRASSRRTRPPPAAPAAPTPEAPAKNPHRL